MRKLLLLFLCCVSFGVSAQSNSSSAAPLYWLVQQVNVKANSTKQYESNIKQLISSMKQQSQKESAFVWYAFASPESAIYTYVTPVYNLDHLEEIYEEMAQEANTFSKLHQSISGEVNSYNVSLMQTLPNLCIQSSNSQAQAFNVIETIQIAPGQEQTFENLLSQWVQSAKGSQLNFSVFQTLIGSNLPVYTIVHNGSSLTAFKQQFSSQSARGLLMSGDALGVLKDYKVMANTYVDWLSNLNE